MKRIFVLLATVLLFAAACNNAKKEEAAAGKKDSTATSAAQAAAPVDSATMMKNWQAYMTPGDMHKMVASWDGNWTCAVTSWMQPGAPPMTNGGTATNKMILGGRYQSSYFKGSFEGMPFEGMGTLGYDNAKKIFISTWVDNMGTGVMKLEGPWDAATKSMELKGIMIDPGTGKEAPVRETFVINDDNTQTMAMYAKGPDGKEFKTMEIVFKRAK